MRKNGSERILLRRGLRPPTTDNTNCHKVKAGPDHDHIFPTQPRASPESQTKHDTAGKRRANAARPQSWRSLRRKYNSWQVYEGPASHASGVDLWEYPIRSCVQLQCRRWFWLAGGKCLYVDGVWHDFSSLNQFRIKCCALQSREANIDPGFVYGELRLSHLLSVGPFLVPLQGGTVSGPPNP
jgi:hypothetical protein